MTDVTEYIFPRVSERMGWRDSSSDVKFIVVLDSPDFSVVVSGDPLHIGVDEDPFLTNSDLVSDSSSPIEIISAIDKEDLIFGGFNHLVALIDDIGWVNWILVRTNFDSSHPKSVITVDGPND